MSNIFNELIESEDFRQGDIFKAKKDEGQINMKFVLTADCDIAQKKSRNTLTTLDIVTTRYFVDHIWANEFLSKLIDREIIKALDYLNTCITKFDSKLTSLTAESLDKWLNETTVDIILQGLEVKKPDSSIKKSLEAVQVFFKSKNDVAIKRLANVYKALGKQTESILDLIKSELRSPKGFGDYFLLPELPTDTPYGYVVLLRSISTNSIDEFYKSALDARIGGQPDAFYRICRLNESVRYSISQKLGFLFSRIGMHEEFESDCISAVELVIENTKLEN